MFTLPFTSVVPLSGIVAGLQDRAAWIRVAGRMVAVETVEHFAPDLLLAAHNQTVGAHIALPVHPDQSVRDRHFP
jgi:hypothetical protein